MLNKKCLFGGGLYLVNTAVIAIYTSSVAVAEDCSILNKQNQIYWRFYANNTRLKAEGQSEWIKNKKYRDSIINVIGKAIGDCMAEENEFKHWNREELGDKVILFEDKKKYKSFLHYTISNWNAVFLYNAVNLAINNKKYWIHKDFTVENLMKECYNRISTYFFDELGILEDAKRVKKKQEWEQKQLTECEKQITEYFKCVCEGKNKVINELKEAKKRETDTGKLDDIRSYIEVHKLELNDVIALQEALKNFDKNEGDDMGTLYNEAINKLEQANKPRKIHSGFTSHNTRALNDNIYCKILYYLDRKRSMKVTLELPKKLEKAKSDMIKYFKALDLCKILKDVYGDFREKRTRSPAKQQKNKFMLVDNGERYDTFIYDDILMDLKIENTGNYLGKKPVIQEIGYAPYFFVKGDNICISGVDKVKWTDGSILVGSKAEQLENYGWSLEDKYADLLELLQGLVVPIKKDYAFLL